MKMSSILGCLCPHHVWRLPLTLEFVSWPSLSYPAYWDHEVHCSLGGKSKYWVALTEVIVSPCLDTTSNWCLLDLLCFPWIYKCMNCFVFGCIKCTAFPDKFQNRILDLFDKSLLKPFFFHWEHMTPHNELVDNKMAVFHNFKLTRQMIFIFCKLAIFVTPLVLCLLSATLSLNVKKRRKVNIL